MQNFKERLNHIKTFLFDVDGVLTNGSVLIMENGEVVRNMNSKDAYALQLAADLFMAKPALQCPLQLSAFPKV